MENINMPTYPQAPQTIKDTLRRGIVIPAHPLALTSERKFDPRHQRALTRYYLDAGAGGVAVGVHSTQFEIRDPRYNLFRPVLALTSDTIAAWECDHPESDSIVRIAGICGPTRQAVEEARTARELGYHAGLLSMAAMRGFSLDEQIAHARIVAQEIPLFGFYLQPAAGGIILPYRFWREFTEIPNVIGIKFAPFNRYQTLDVVRAVADSGRADEICLYTGNDDHIVLDLISQYEVQTSGGAVRLTCHGGLLGHWSCWTQRAVWILDQCRQARQARCLPLELTALANQVTDCNGAFFDAANQYAGALSGVNEVLRRQGLMASAVCLNEREKLSPGQAGEIERVYRAYPDLNDDNFVKENLERWLS
jgi:dihydrodipicolinate synthase/N-acetylneuraminate lyase